MTSVVRSPRHVVTAPSFETIFSGQQQIDTGGSWRACIENVTQDGSTADTAEVFSPLATNLLHDDYDRLVPVMGNLIDAVVIAPIPGIELRIYESFNGKLDWILSDAVMLNATLPTFVRAFRFVGHFAKIEVYNGGLVSVTVPAMVRVSTS